MKKGISFEGERERVGREKREKGKKEEKLV